MAYLCFGQCLDVLLCLLTVDEGKVAVRGRAQGLDDQLELVYVVLAWKQWLPLQQLCQYTPHRPAGVWIRQDFGTSAAQQEQQKLCVNPMMI